MVWLARDQQLDRDVALKFLPEMVALDAEAIADLKRETRRALDLTHARIVRIFDFVQDSLTAAISMEYVDGQTLTALKLAKPNGHFEVEELRPLVAQLCAALDYAHSEAKVIHRDLKPANLMVNSRGELKITDFGISASISDSTTRVSKLAANSGTPVNMSPQQMMGDKPAVTDDIYSLGATLYELLTGKPPFFTGNVVLQMQSKVPPSISERRTELGKGGHSIPSAWESMIRSCLAKSPEQRPQSVIEMRALLEESELGPKLHFDQSNLVPQDRSPRNKPNSDSSITNKSVTPPVETPTAHVPVSDDKVAHSSGSLNLLRIVSGTILLAFALIFVLATIAQNNRDRAYILSWALALLTLAGNAFPSNSFSKFQRWLGVVLLALCFWLSALLSANPEWKGMSIIIGIAVITAGTWVAHLKSRKLRLAIIAVGSLLTLFGYCLIALK